MGRRAFTNGIERIDFHRTKYGPEILIDVAWIHEMPAFILDRPHSLNFYDITLITGGAGTLRLDDRIHPVRPGVVLFSSPGQVRLWDATELRGICLFFPETYLSEFFLDELFLERLPYFHDAANARLLLSRAAAGRLREGLKEMRNELRSWRADSVHALRARLYETLIALSRAYEFRRPGKQASSPPELVRRFRGLLEKNVAKHHQVSDYANALGVSPGHLNAICRMSTGRSAKTLILDLLVLRARRLLLYTDRTVEAIGLTLGFDDPSYFSRFFRRAAGRTPSEFRAQSGRVEKGSHQRAHDRRL